MFEFDAGKIIIVGVIALIFIPPKDLPRVLRQVGQFVGKMRRMASEFQGQFMDAMREADMADLRREAEKLSEAARVSTGLDSLRDLNSHMTSTLDRPATRDETPAAEATPAGVHTAEPPPSEPSSAAAVHEQEALPAPIEPAEPAAIPAGAASGLPPHEAMRVDEAIGHSA